MNVEIIETAKQYICGLQQAYLKNNAKAEWEDFERVKHGAAKEDLDKIKKEYPVVSNSLIELLEYVDGTYHREYQGDEITFYFLGSDVDDCAYPYYLLSAEEILEEAELGKEHGYGLYDFLYWINENGYFELYDDKLTNNSDMAKWLCFSHCMNNGGTSILFIDFTPSKKGKVGQVVRFLHDPDQYRVIADSFDDYLKMLMDNCYGFINGDTV